MILWAFQTLVRKSQSRRTYFHVRQVECEWSEVRANGQVHVKDDFREVLRGGVHEATFGIPNS